MTPNVLWLRADGQLNTVLFARLIVTTVMGRNFLNTVNKTQWKNTKHLSTVNYFVNWLQNILKHLLLYFAIIYAMKMEVVITINQLTFIEHLKNNILKK